MQNSRHMIFGAGEPVGPHLPPTPAQLLMLRRIYTEMDVPEQERRMPANRFDAQKQIRMLTTRCCERRAHLRREQLKDIQPSAQQMQDLEDYWDDLNVPENLRCIPETKEGAKTAIMRFDTEVGHRKVQYADWRKQKDRYEAADYPVPEPPRAPVALPAGR